MSAGDLFVRAATAADQAALATLARRAITVTAAPRYDGDQIAAWSSSFTAAAFEQLVDTQSVFVVEADRDAAGVASLLVRDDGRAEVDLLYVDPSYTGRGVARVALAAVESEARHRNITELWADASLLATPVFEHLGYVVVERYRKKRGAVSFPNTWLAKQLV